MFSKYRQYRKELAWINHARKVTADIDQLGETIFNLPSRQNDEESQINRARFDELDRHCDALLDSMTDDIPWYAKIVPVK